MVKRVFCIFVAIFAMTIAMGMTVYASPHILFEPRPNRDTVLQGTSVVFTVYVSPQTNYVWARAGVAATPVPHRLERAGAPAGTPEGTRVFEVAVPIFTTGNVYILANATNNLDTAQIWPIRITVLDGQPVVPGAVPGIQIISVTETHALRPNSVQLTVVTGAQAGEVWVRLGVYPNNTYWRGVLQSETPNSRVWTINYTPAFYEPHRVQVGSNTTYTLIGASLRYFDVELTAPYLPRHDPQIFGSTISTNNINVGNSVTIRVSTNQDVYSVWVVDADGIESVARRIPPFMPDAIRHFEVMVAPYRTGALTVYAGIGVGDPHAVSTVKNVVVHVPHVYISQVVVTQVANSVHEEAQIRVTTNQQTGSVWAVLPDGETIRLNLVGQPGAGGSRVWEARPAGIPTPNITIRVSATTSDIPSVTQTISNWGAVIGGGQAPVVTGIANFTPDSARRGSRPEVSFTVPDNITQVRISGNHGVSEVNALRMGHAQAGRQLWGRDIVLPSGTHITHVTLTVTTYIDYVLQDIAHHNLVLTN